MTQRNNGMSNQNSNQQWDRDSERFREQDRSMQDSRDSSQERREDPYTSDERRSRDQGDYGRGQQNFGYGQQSGYSSGSYGFDDRGDDRRQGDSRWGDSSRMGSQGDWRGDNNRGGWGQDQYGGNQNAQGQSGWRSGMESYDRQYGSNQGQYGSQNQYGNQGGYGQGNGMNQGYSQGNAGQWGQPAESHAGKGPRNYQRDQKRIVEDINDRLEAHHGIDATEIEVSFENNEVILKGTVRDRQQKRMAEEVAEGVSGVREVQNQIRVQRDDNRDTASTGMSASKTEGNTRK